jgi:hypothetical protein
MLQQKVEHFSIGEVKLMLTSRKDNFVAFLDFVVMRRSGKIGWGRGEHVTPCIALLRAWIDKKSLQGNPKARVMLP